MLDSAAPAAGPAAKFFEEYIKDKQWIAMNKVPLKSLHQAIFANSNQTPAQYVLSLLEPVGVAVDNFAEKGSESMSEKVSWSRVVLIINEDLYEQAFPSVMKDSQEAERARKRLSCEILPYVHAPGSVATLGGIGCALSIITRAAIR
jgi:hypothetical protein